MNYMKKKSILLLLSVLTLNLVYPQNKLTGVVANKSDNTPIQFVNVMLYAADSTFIAGTVTDSLGVYKLDTKLNNGNLIKVSMVGYKTQWVGAQQGQIILLEPTINELKEITVTGENQLYKMEANGLISKVENTLLSHLGTARDVLKQLPFITENNGDVNVFGRGKPLIYINNRLMRDDNELKEIKSTEIKDVRIILNPGAQYDATVNAVIKISTIKSVGEGLSGSFFTYLQQNRTFNHFENVKLNYRVGGLDVFGGINYFGYKIKQNQINKISLFLENTNTADQTFSIGANSGAYQMNAGFNYSVNPKHSFGLRYNYNLSPKSLASYWVNGTSKHFVDDINDYNLTMEGMSHPSSQRHYANAYYHGEFNNKTELQFEGDYLSGNNLTDQSTTNRNLMTNSENQVNTTSETNYHLYAGKLWLTTPLFTGKMTLGCETALTRNDQEYKMLNEELENELPSNFNTSKQSLAAAFLIYDFIMKKFSFQAGLRYEYIDYNYFYMGERQPEQSKKYTNWFPSFSISYNGAINTSLNYRNTVSRPNYRQLTSSIEYFDPYTYQGGNPALKPSFKSKLNYLFGWKNLNIDISYSWYRDGIINTSTLFNNKPIVLFSYENMPHFGMFDAEVSYSPTIRFWKPKWEAGVSRQNFTYQGRQYNEPYFTYGWRNLITLPKDYLLSVDMWGTSKGQLKLVNYKPNFRTDITVNKSFLNRNLNASVCLTDIFNTDREWWYSTQDNIYFYKWNDRDSRGVYLQLTYTFNPSRSNYKGKGAAGSELNRL